MSPDPASCEQSGGTNNCAANPPELYVRENGEKTVPVSRDTLLPDVGGLPAPAPIGVSEMPNPTQQVGGIVEQDGAFGAFVFASPDGSQAFFQSEDRLTSDAPEGPLGNTSAKTYDFDVDTGALTYLPGVAGQIMAVDGDGSSLAFMNSSVSPAELDLWSAAPDGGVVTSITQLPEGHAEPARMSRDGSVVVFTTRGLPGFNDGAAEEIFRYDAGPNELTCVSCPPVGVTPTGAVMSPRRSIEVNYPGFLSYAGLVEPRGYLCRWRPDLLRNGRSAGSSGYEHGDDRTRDRQWKPGADTAGE